MHGIHKLRMIIHSVTSCCKCNVTYQEGILQRIVILIFIILLWDRSQRTSYLRGEGGLENGYFPILFVKDEEGWEGSKVLILRGRPL